MQIILKILLSIFLLSYHIISFADSAQSTTVIGQRAKKEEKVPANSFAINFYKPTFILPYYYTFSPYNSVYRNNTPSNEQLKHGEFKYQFSVKVPAWKNILNSHTSLFMAYTQLSYWQLYNKKPFFRETDYEPEIFVSKELNYSLSHDLKINFFNLGLTHQSNGFGNNLERSWNRAYVEAIGSTKNWMISLKPWYIISTNNQNSDIGKYLGYGRALVAYKWNHQVIAMQVHNIIESHGKHATAELTYSFQLTPYLKGFIDTFSGYGQSLIEYNHRTNSIGVGIALNDWI